MDLSTEMLAKLKEKAPDARVVQGDVLEYEPEKKFDYIFISSGSVSLFTDMQLCRKILLKMKRLLRKGGKFVFAVDTVEDRCPDDAEYRTSVSVKTKDGFTLILKGKNYYDETTNTQYAPSIYELYDGTTLLQQERMDFQTHLYKFGEMERYLREIGFEKIKTYSSFQKEIAAGSKCEMFLFECSLG